MAAAFSPENSARLFKILQGLPPRDLEAIESVFVSQRDEIADLKERLDRSGRASDSGLVGAINAVNANCGKVLQASKNTNAALSQLQSIVKALLTDFKQDLESVIGGIVEHVQNAAIDPNIQQHSDVHGSDDLAVRLMDPWQRQVLIGDCGNSLSATKHKEICMGWLPSLRDMGIRARDSFDDKHNESVLIEFRELPHIEAILLNTIAKLPEWKHTIVCGPKNAAFVKAFNIEGLNVIVWPQNISRVSEYSQLLRLTPEFWNQFTGDRVLVHQEDSWIFNTKHILPALEWEYCGAPWPIHMKLAPNGVGNGGFSLRCPKKMAANCGRRTDRFPDWIANPNIRSRWPQKQNGTWVVPEDIHFCNIKADKIKVAPVRIAKNFALDSYKLTEDYSAGHKWWQCANPRTNYFKKVRIIDTYWVQSKSDHRCGWFQAIQHLFQSEWLGVAMRGAPQSDEVKMISAIDCYEFHSPILEPWIGVLHAPYLDPAFFSMNPILHLQCFNGGKHPLSSDGFAESLTSCELIIVMNENEIDPLRTWLEKGWGVCPDIGAWTHPISINSNFAPAPLDESTLGTWPIVQLGRQDRIFSEIYTLTTARKRQWVNRLADEETLKHVEEEAKAREKEVLGEVEILSLSDAEFDKKLQSSVVLIPLWAATANNSVLEILSLNVPAFVSRLPATEDVLGAEYPMFYNDAFEIEDIIDNNVELLSLMERTREYLMGLDKSRFSLESFEQQVARTIVRL